MPTMPNNINLSAVSKCSDHDLKSFTSSATSFSQQSVSTTGKPSKTKTSDQPLHDCNSAKLHELVLLLIQPPHDPLIKDLVNICNRYENREIEAMEASYINRWEEYARSVVMNLSIRFGWTAKIMLAFIKQSTKNEQYTEVKKVLQDIRRGATSSSTQHQVVPQPRYYDVFLNIQTIKEVQLGDLNVNLNDELRKNLKPEYLFLEKRFRWKQGINSSSDQNIKHGLIPQIVRSHKDSFWKASSSLVNETFGLRIKLVDRVSIFNQTSVLGVQHMEHFAFIVENVTFDNAEIYPNFHNENNQPVFSGRQVASYLTKLGYNCFTCLNFTFEEILDAVEGFCKLISPNSKVVLLLGSHGMCLSYNNSSNYHEFLMAKNTASELVNSLTIPFSENTTNNNEHNPVKDFAKRMKAVLIDDLINKIYGKLNSDSNGMLLVILDCCRKPSENNQMGAHTVLSTKWNQCKNLRLFFSTLFGDMALVSKTFGSFCFNSFIEVIEKEILNKKGDVEHLKTYDVNLMLRDLSKKVKSHVDQKIQNQHGETLCNFTFIETDSTLHTLDSDYRYHALDGDRRLLLTHLCSDKLALIVGNCLQDGTKEMLRNIRQLLHEKFHFSTHYIEDLVEENNEIVKHLTDLMKCVTKGTNVIVLLVNEDGKATFSNNIWEYLKAICDKKKNSHHYFHHDKLNTQFHRAMRLYNEFSWFMTQGFQIDSQPTDTLNGNAMWINSKLQNNNSLVYLFHQVLMTQSQRNDPVINCAEEMKNLCGQQLGDAYSIVLGSVMSMSTVLHFDLISDNRCLTYANDESDHDYNMSMIKRLHWILSS